jgi:DNA polymerase-3 subunit epsilon
MTTPWTEHPRVAFDLETTGPDPLEARIVTASVIRVNPDGTITDHGEWLVDPGVEIPEGATAVHGITTAMAQDDGKRPEVGVTEIFAALAQASADGLPIIGHNVAYDLTVLARELHRHGLPGNVQALHPVIDSLVIDKAADKFRKGKRTLTVTAEHYGVALSEEDAHASAADAYAAERIATALTDRNPKLAVDAAKLHGWQIRWAAEQAKSLQDYFNRQGKAETVDGTWPVRLIPADPDYTAAIEAAREAGDRLGVELTRDVLAALVTAAAPHVLAASREAGRA